MTTTPHSTVRFLVGTDWPASYQAGEIAAFDLPTAGKLVQQGIAAFHSLDTSVGPQSSFRIDQSRDETGTATADGPPLVFGILTLSETVAVAGAPYVAAIRGFSVISGATIAATSSDGTTLTVSATTVSGVFMMVGTPSVTLIESAGSQSQTTVVVVTVDPRSVSADAT